VTADPPPASLRRLFDSAAVLPVLRAVVLFVVVLLAARTADVAVAVGATVTAAVLLGLGVGKKVPSWDEAKKEFVPKTEAQITLSFDHRSIDGGGAGRLLKRVIELLEDPKKL